MLCWSPPPTRGRSGGGMGNNDNPKYPSLTLPSQGRGKPPRPMATPPQGGIGPVHISRNYLLSQVSPPVEGCRRRGGMLFVIVYSHRVDFFSYSLAFIKKMCIVLQVRLWVLARYLTASLLARYHRTRTQRRTLFFTS